MNGKSRIRKMGSKVVGVVLLTLAIVPGQTPAMDSSPVEVERRIGVLERRVAELEQQREARASALGQALGAADGPEVRFLYGAGSRTGEARFWPDYWERLRQNGH